jgi:Holliday junction DNA helicase RuvB
MLNGYIGQEDRLAALHATIRAHQNGRPLPNMLFLGNSGLGKTTLAEALARETDKKFIVVHAPSIEDRSELAERIVDADGGVLFIDEIHALIRSMAEDMYTVMDRKVVTQSYPLFETTYRNIFALSADQVPPDMWHGPDVYRIPVRGKKAGIETTETQLSGVTIIGATTDEALLPTAFLSRLSQLKVYLRPYNLVELATIATLYADSMGITVDKEAMIYLAERSRSTPRMVKHLLDRAADFAAPESHVDASVAALTTAALGIDAHGLEEPHRAILRALAEGPLSRTSLGQSLGISASNLGLYWGDLMAQGFVKVTTRHEITERGINAI